jgi:hypothetical protein
MPFDQFLKFMLARPFEPFWMRTVDGREYFVRHPEEVQVSAGGSTVLLAHQTGQFEYIDMAHVVSLRTHGPVDPDKYDTDRGSFDPDDAPGGTDTPGDRDE